MLNAICSSQTDSVFSTDLIFEDSTLDISIEVIINLLKERWHSFLCDRPLVDEKVLAHEILTSNSQEKVIKELASKTFFIKKSTSWSKTCEGHEFFISFKPLRGKEVDQLIRKISAFLNRNPEVMGELTRGKKVPVRRKKNKYLGKFRLVHLNNAHSCTSPSKELSHKQIVSVLNLLNDVDAFIANRALDPDREYKLLFKYITN